MPLPTSRPAADQPTPEPRPVASPDAVLGLRTRLDLLRDQLADATRQRDALTAQLRPGPSGPGLSPQVSGGVEARVRILDERILRLEREQSTTQAQLSGAAPEALARATRLVTTPRTAASAGSTGLGGVMAPGFAVGAAVGVPGGVLLTLAALVLARRRRRRATAAAPAIRAERDPRVAELAQAMDVVAVEVERIGEGQRFVTQLLVEDRDARTPAGPAPARDATR